MKKREVNISYRFSVDQITSYTRDKINGKKNTKKSDLILIFCDFQISQFYAKKFQLYMCLKVREESFCFHIVV